MIFCGKLNEDTVRTIGEPLAKHGRSMGEALGGMRFLEIVTTRRSKLGPLQRRALLGEFSNGKRGFSKDGHDAQSHRIERDQLSNTVGNSATSPALQLGVILEVWL